MSDSGFTKRVHLLEYWAPSLLSKLKDLDDLADCILSVWDTAEQHAEERIIKLLEEQLAKHTLDNGTVYIEFQVISELIALIKGEQK